MSQPHLINRIIATISGTKDARRAITPAQSGELLNKDVNGKLRREVWNYISVIGMLNFLVNCTHPEMVYAVHQCTRFSNNPRRSHEVALK